MDSLSEKKNWVNKLSNWWIRHWLEIAIFAIILFTVTLIIGLWRLKKITPEKQPIRFEKPS